jgi:hypothetical protein
MNEWNIQLQSFLSGIANLPQGPRKGRDIYNGYVRGCGLQYGNLQALCQSDPVFTKAYELATAIAPSGKPRTVVGALNLINIFTILKLNLAHGGIPGHIVEFGSLRGGSAIFMAYAARQLMPGVKVIGFDTFEGLPEVNSDVDIFRKGDFEHPDVDELRAHVRSLGLDNLSFVKGPFEETLAGALKEIGPVALAHIDCDIYEAVVCCYNEARFCTHKGIPLKVEP